MDKQRTGQQEVKPRGGKGPMIRFVVLFVLVAAVLHGVYRFLLLAETGLLHDSLYMPYMRGLAAVCGTIIRLFGDDVVVQGTSIGGIHLVGGCDGFEPLIVFGAAVLGFPSRVRSKLIALAAGGAMLLSVNAMRAVTLYFINQQAPRYFHLMHREIWPLALILLALLTWLLWARKALASSRGLVTGDAA